MKVIAWIIGLPIAIIVVWGIGRLLFCRPDKSIQQVTDPLATAILNHINAHGRPESLADIPDLPYRVEGCKKLHSDDKSIYREQCTFIKDGSFFSIAMNYDCLADNDLLGCHTISVSNASMNTTIFYYVKESHSDNKTLIFGHIRFDAVIDSLLCKNGILRMG